MITKAQTTKLNALLIVLCTLVINLPAQAQSLLTRTTMAENATTPQQLDGHANRRHGFEPKKHAERHYGNKHENKHSPKHYTKREAKHHKRGRKHQRYNKHDYRSHKTRHHYHGNNYCEESHARHDRGHRGSWHHAGDFRTKSRGDTTRTINIHDKVSRLQLSASKRSTYVHRAFVEFANGQTRRVHDLEGELSWGEPLDHRFRHQRQVVALHLEVSKASRKRGYAKVNYKNY